MEGAELSQDEVPIGIDWKAVHGSLDLVAAGAWKTKRKRSGKEIYAGRAGRLGQDHNLQPADTHVGNSGFHRLPRLSVVEGPARDTGPNSEAVSRQAARFPAGGKRRLQQLRLCPAGLPDGKDQRPELRAVRARE